MKYLLIGFAFILTAFAAASTVTFSDVRATSESDGVLVQWTTSQEEGIKDFAIEKASQIGDGFFAIGTVSPAGAGNVYQFEDKAIYKTSSSSLFVYRIRADGTDNSVTYSKLIPVTYEFSGLSGVARRTWGSIKAMFR